MKKSLLFLAGMLLLAVGSRADYIETKNLNLEAVDIRELEIDAGAGFLEIRGMDNLTQIEVIAEIVMEGFDDDEAVEYIERYMKLDLAKKGTEARLNAFFEEKGFHFNFFGNQSSQINLTIKMPNNLMLNIDDGSGYISIEDMAARIKIDDGSGEITLMDISGDLVIEDGSGEIEIENITGNIELEDGSGSINITAVRGGVYIDDGSGDTELVDIDGEVEIDDGSGDMNIRQVTGNVRVDDGSGDIRINGVNQDVEIVSDGSGGVRITNVDGRVKGDVEI